MLVDVKLFVSVMMLVVVEGVFGFVNMVMVELVDVDVLCNWIVVICVKLNVFEVGVWWFVEVFVLEWLVSGDWLDVVWWLMMCFVVVWEIVCVIDCVDEVVW